MFKEFLLIQAAASTEHSLFLNKNCDHKFLHTGCAVTPCSKQIFSQIFSIILLFHNSKPGKWFLLIGWDSSLRTNRYCRRHWRQAFSKRGLSARQFRRNIA
jgi:hypothetical protein